MMNDITVLSTACGAMFMPGFFRCLKENNERRIRIIGVDVDASPMTGDFIDGYYQVPVYNSENYVDVLLNICKIEKVKIFFPHISMELPIVLFRLESFEKLGIKVAITDSRTLLVANNKYKLYECMQKHGLKTPKYYRITSSLDLQDKAFKLGYPEKPVCVKITESSGSRGIRVVRKDIHKAEEFLHQKPNTMNISMDDMCQILNECSDLPEIIVMDYLPGCEYTVDLLADHGKTLYIAGRRNYESNMSIAMATYIEKNDNAYKLCVDIVSILKLDGNIGFDFIFDENNEPILTDLNPRITATIIIYKEGGLNFPYLRVKQLLGEKLPQIEIKYGVRMKRKYMEMFD